MLNKNTPQQYHNANHPHGYASQDDAFDDRLLTYCLDLTHQVSVLAQTTGDLLLMPDTTEIAFTCCLLTAAANANAAMPDTEADEMLVRNMRAILDCPGDSDPIRHRIHVSSALDNLFNLHQAYPDAMEQWKAHIDEGAARILSSVIEEGQSTLDGPAAHELVDDFITLDKLFCQLDLLEGDH